MDEDYRNNSIEKKHIKNSIEELKDNNNRNVIDCSKFKNAKNSLSLYSSKKKNLKLKLRKSSSKENNNYNDYINSNCNDFHDKNNNNNNYYNNSKDKKSKIKIEVIKDTNYSIQDNLNINNNTIIDKETLQSIYNQSKSILDKVIKRNDEKLTYYENNINKVTKNNFSSNTKRVDSSIYTLDSFKKHNINNNLNNEENDNNLININKTKISDNNVNNKLDNSIELASSILKSYFNEDKRKEENSALKSLTKYIKEESKKSTVNKNTDCIVNRKTSLLNNSSNTINKDNLVENINNNNNKHNNDYKYINNNLKINANLNSNNNNNNSNDNSFNNKNFIDSMNNLSNIERICSSNKNINKSSIVKEDSNYIHNNNSYILKDISTSKTENNNKSTKHFKLNKDNNDIFNNKILNSKRNSLINENSCNFNIINKSTSNNYNLSVEKFNINLENYDDNNNDKSKKKDYKQKIVLIEKELSECKERNMCLNKDLTNINNELKQAEFQRFQLHKFIESIRGNIRVFLRVKAKESVSNNNNNNNNNNIINYWYNDSKSNTISVDSLTLVNNNSFNYNSSIYKNYSSTNNSLNKININKNSLNESTEKFNINNYKSLSYDSSFHFNKIFREESSQEEVFNQVKPLLISALDGENICLFAYGATGTGKTYTMQGKLNFKSNNFNTELNNESSGILPRAALLIFEEFDRRRKFNETFSMSISAVEVYNDNVHDLLYTNSTEKHNNLNKSNNINNSKNYTNISKSIKKSSKESNNKIINSKLTNKIFNKNNNKLAKTLNNSNLKVINNSNNSNYNNNNNNNNNNNINKNKNNINIKTINRNLSSNKNVHTNKTNSSINNNNKLKEKKQIINNQVKNLTWENIKDKEDIIKYILKAGETRATESTNFNTNSSRSHAIYQIKIEKKTNNTNLVSNYNSKNNNNNNTNYKTNISYINIIDLAGSEKSCYTQNNSNNNLNINEDKLKKIQIEAGFINKSLTTLGRIIKILSERSNITPPYRESKLTQLLQNSLSNNNCKTALIITVINNQDNYSQTKDALNFAKTAMVAL